MGNVRICDMLRICMTDEEISSAIILGSSTENAEFDEKNESDGYT